MPVLQVKVKSESSVVLHAPLESNQGSCSSATQRLEQGWGSVGYLYKNRVGLPRPANSLFIIIKVEMKITLSFSPPCTILLSFGRGFRTVVNLAASRVCEIPSQTGK